MRGMGLGVSVEVEGTAMTGATFTDVPCPTRPSTAAAAHRLPMRLLPPPLLSSPSHLLHELQCSEAAIKAFSPAPSPPATLPPLSPLPPPPTCSMSCSTVRLSSKQSPLPLPPPAAPLVAPPSPSHLLHELQYSEAELKAVSPAPPPSHLLPPLSPLLHPPTCSMSCSTVRLRSKPASDGALSPSRDRDQITRENTS